MMKKLAFATRAALLLPLILSPAQSQCDGPADVGDETCLSASQPTFCPSPQPTREFLIQYNEEKCDRHEYYRKMLKSEKNHCVTDEKPKLMREHWQRESREQEAMWDIMRAQKESLLNAGMALGSHDICLRILPLTINSLPKVAAPQAEDSSVKQAGKKQEEL